MNGRTQVTERRQAPGAAAGRGTTGRSAAGRGMTGRDGTERSVAGRGAAGVRRAPLAGLRRGAPAAPAAGRQPRPAGQRPAGAQSAEARPARAGPAAARTAGQRAAGERLAGARPAEARPAGGRPAGPGPAHTRRAGARPAGAQSAGAQSAARPLPGQRTAPESRTRFVFLVVGLLGGGLLCLLIINTVLATGAFQITALQQGNVALAQQEQAVQAQIAAEESPSSLAHRAAALGMVIQPRLHFLNLTTGRLQSQPGHMPGIPTVPGYTP